VEQPVAFEGSDKNVVETVIVIIRYGNAHSVHRNTQSTSSRDIGECSVLVVPI
jgi:hypothetical protein